MALLAVISILVALQAPAAAAEADSGDVADEKVALAIEAGLHWLATQQAKDGAAAGSWESAKYPTAVASLCGLAFLANGRLPGKGRYGDVVKRALTYVQGSITEDGYAGNIGDSMYVHAICTLFALSCLGMNEDVQKDVDFAKTCRKALDVIIRAQQVPKPVAEKGGWRYSPVTQESDLSVTSWQMLCLHAARQCGFAIDDSVIAAAMRYVNSGYVQTGKDTGGFVYRPGRDTSPEYGVTGTSVLLKAIFEGREDKQMGDSLHYLTSFEVGWGGAQYRGYFFFSTLYLMQGLFQMGGDDYNTIARQVRKTLVENQAGDGHWAYPSGSSAERQGVGPVYPTAMAVLILSLDKQYLPIFQRQRSLYR